MSDITEHRCKVLAAMHKLKGVATASALASMTKLRGDEINAAIDSLEKDGWITFDLSVLHGVFRLTPAKRRERLTVLD